jgi:hypothetical protein
MPTEDGKRYVYARRDNSLVWRWLSRKNSTGLCHRSGNVSPGEQPAADRRTQKKILVKEAKRARTTLEHKVGKEGRKGRRDGVITF